MNCHACCCSSTVLAFGENMQVERGRVQLLPLCIYCSTWVLDTDTYVHNVLLSLDVSGTACLLRSAPCPWGRRASSGCAGRMTTRSSTRTYVAGRVSRHYVGHASDHAWYSACCVCSIAGVCKHTSLAMGQSHVFCMKRLFLPLAQIQNYDL